jgi:hypothetical protein
MARMTDAQVFEYIGMTREEVAAAVAGKGKPQLVQKTPHVRPRPKCLICGKRINKYNCQPVRYKKRKA